MYPHIIIELGKFLLLPHAHVLYDNTDIYHKKTTMACVRDYCMTCDIPQENYTIYHISSHMLSLYSLVTLVLFLGFGKLLLQMCCMISQCATRRLLRPARNLKIL